MIVMVSGRAGEGKTTFSNFCIECLDDNKLKGSIVPFARGVKDTAKFMGWDGKKDDAGRQLLQGIGNVGRQYNEDIWAAKAISEVTQLFADGYDVVFIDDWRFPNEGNVVQDYFGNVLKVRIHRPKEDHTLFGTDLYNDKSETSLPELHDNRFTDLRGRITITGHPEPLDNSVTQEVIKFYDEIVFNIYGLEELRNNTKYFVEKIILPNLGG